MMKEMMFFVAAAMVLAACGSSKAQSDDAEANAAPVDSLVEANVTVKKPASVSRAQKPNLWTVSAVETQLRACFAEVNRMAEGDGINVGLLDGKYCSKDFLELKGNLEKKVQKGEVKFEGDEGYHWTLGIGTPMTVDSLKAELLTRDQAKAELWLVDGHENRGYVELTLYLEDGAWKIHNWIDSDVYPFGALFNWMQSVYDGYADDEETDGDSTTVDTE